MNSNYIQALREDLVKNDAEIAELKERLNEMFGLARAQESEIAELKARQLSRDKIIDLLEKIELEVKGESFTLPNATGFNRCCIEQLADAIVGAIEGK